MRGRSNPRSRGRLRKPRPSFDPTDPHSLAAQAERHLLWLEVRGYSASTLENRRRYLVDFCLWCADRGITMPAELTRLVLDLYQRYIAHATRPDCMPLSVKTQRHKLDAVAGLCKWMARERLLLYNPAAEMEMPRQPVTLPHAVLSAEEAEKVLAVPDVSTPLGLRDRAMLETFYSTGIRRAELVALRVSDLDLEREAMAVRQGKGKKDRFLPVGERATAWISKYLAEARPYLVFGEDNGALFLTTDGTPLGLNYLSGLIRRIVTLAGLGKQGSCHLLRHTMATLMLEGGADVRFIQQMLGHANLDTTMIYTRVSIEALRLVHAATHPGARLRRASGECSVASGQTAHPAEEQPATKDEEPSSRHPGILLDEEEGQEHAGEAGAGEELLRALAAEDEECLDA